MLSSWKCNNENILRSCGTISSFRGSESEHSKFHLNNKIQIDLKYFKAQVSNSLLVLNEIHLVFDSIIFVKVPMWFLTQFKL